MNLVILILENNNFFFFPLFLCIDQSIAMSLMHIKEDFVYYAVLLQLSNIIILYILFDFFASGRFQSLVKNLK